MYSPPPPDYFDEYKSTSSQKSLFPLTTTTTTTTTTTNTNTKDSPPSNTPLSSLRKSLRPEVIRKISNSRLLDSVSLSLSHPHSPRQKSSLSRQYTATDIDFDIDADIDFDADADAGSDVNLAQSQLPSLSIDTASLRDTLSTTNPQPQPLPQTQFHPLSPPLTLSPVSLDETSLLHENRLDFNKENNNNLDSDLFDPNLDNDNDNDVIPFPEKVPVLGPPTPPPDYTDYDYNYINNDSTTTPYYKFHYDPMSSITSTKLKSKTNNLASSFVPLRPSNPDNDAGNKPQDHYKSRLEPWRYHLRQCLLPLVRWETPYLAKLQQQWRSPALDLYFALSANLGTHTFYVTCLPMMFWLGTTELGRGFVFVLAFGVYITGFIKDLLCLPRPLSPPLHRITMSGSAALEYGFPSTHTANAVSVFLLLCSQLHANRLMWGAMYPYLVVLNVVFVLSIVLGRLYCGMHGFLDVLCGAFIGTFLWAARLKYGPWMDAIMTNMDSYMAWAVIPIVLLLVRIHPEPIDNCPCFDDGVSFMGVQLGVVLGSWLISKYFDDPSTCKGCIPFNSSDPLLNVVLRFIVGVGFVAVWRHNAKKIFHTILPPLFRLAEKFGLSMPRKFFTPASQYDGVPDPLPDSTFQTSDMKINNLFRVRSDSVGPQSTADVYESIAYREYQRQRGQLSDCASGAACSSSSTSACNPAGATILAPTSPSSGSSGTTPSSSGTAKTKQLAAADEDEDTLLSKISAPRVKYDVEVITRLIVYTGVAMGSTVACAAIFAMVGI